MNLSIGDKVRIAKKPYYWHGAGCVGQIESIEDMETGLPYVRFANGHAELCNPEDCRMAPSSTPLTACLDASPCRQQF